MLQSRAWTFAPRMFIDPSWPSFVTASAVALSSLSELKVVPAYEVLHFSVLKTSYVPHVQARLTSVPLVAHFTLLRNFMRLRGQPMSYG